MIALRTLGCRYLYAGFAGSPCRLYIVGGGVTGTLKADVTSYLGCVIEGTFENKCCERWHTSLGVYLKLCLDFNFSSFPLWSDDRWVSISPELSMSSPTRHRKQSIAVSTISSPLHYFPTFVNSRTQTTFLPANLPSLLHFYSH